MPGPGRRLGAVPEGVLLDGTTVTVPPIHIPAFPTPVLLAHPAPTYLLFHIQQ